MHHRGFRLPLVALGLVACLAACGSDELSTSSGSPPAAAATGTASGTTCPAAPTSSAHPTTSDSFTDSICLNKLPDGLEYGDLLAGTGAAPVTGQTITVQYTGWLTNGTLFDSSRKSGRTPFSFAIGTNAVIKGWDEGVITMRVGGKRRLVIPPALGYGATANGQIPANSTLVFEVELLSVGAASPSPT
jgi:FKBP-type peptidyl-prolyl cis-trans isomerase FkpA